MGSRSIYFVNTGDTGGTKGRAAWAYWLFNAIGSINPLPVTALIFRKSRLEIMVSPPVLHVVVLLVCQVWRGGMPIGIPDRE
jgi:hypothetical protein